MKKLLAFFGALSIIATASPIYAVSCAKNTQISFNSSVNDLKNISTNQISFGVTTAENPVDPDNPIDSVRKELSRLMQIAGAVTFKNSHDYLTWYSKNITEDRIKIFKKPNVNQEILDVNEIGIGVDTRNSIFTISKDENTTEFYIKFNFAELENTYYKISLTTKALIQIDNDNYISGLNNSFLNPSQNKKIDIQTALVKKFYSTIFDDNGSLKVKPNSSSWKIVRYWFFLQIQDFIKNDYFWMSFVNFDDNSLARYTLIDMFEMNFESFFSEVQEEYTNFLAEIIKGAHNNTIINNNHNFKLAKTSATDDFFSVIFNYI
ncbi:lipoprotein [Spiroplasma endosymbiont of Labia minor]|uniref:lipoprotein n=1 Tax=Spiroplasma endosymbiont of Labia minor TaxID=3066305 RepID=UPI0030CE83CD